MPGTATMMFGSVESRWRTGSSTCGRIREVQDETGGFRAFIPWTFQPGSTELEGRPKPPQPWST